MLSAQIRLVVVIDSFQLLEQNESLSSKLSNLCLLFCNSLELFILMHVKTSKFLGRIMSLGQSDFCSFLHLTDIPKTTAPSWK